MGEYTGALVLCRTPGGGREETEKDGQKNEKTLMNIINLGNFIIIDYKNLTQVSGKDRQNLSQSQWVTI